MPVSPKETVSGKGEHQEVVCASVRAADPVSGFVPVETGNTPAVRGYRTDALSDHDRIVQLFSSVGHSFFYLYACISDKQEGVWKQKK